MNILYCVGQTAIGTKQPKDYRGVSVGLVLEETEAYKRAFRVEFDNLGRIVLYQQYLDKESLELPGMMLMSLSKNEAEFLKDAIETLDLKQLFSTLKTQEETSNP